jgi:hypothetical protein
MSTPSFQPSQLSSCVPSRFQLRFLIKWISIINTIFGIKGDIDRKGGCLVAWKKATRPKKQGALGIDDLRAHNTALLTKSMHKFYNKVNLPWVQLTWQAFYSRPTPPHHRKDVGSFWWRDVMSISDNFFMMAKCVANEGSTIYFWRDAWNAGVLQWKFPQLYSFTLNKNTSAKSFMSGDIHRHFWRPLYIEASSQL